ncbi:hypothetical protein FS842_004982 [Serendipita sp. 407]|nr:hypothetical protein FS842_004982 [Serendipita sp. 407]
MKLFHALKKSKWKYQISQIIHHKTPSSISSSLPTLPVELWIEILSNIRARRQLFRLLSVCRTFKAIIEPQIYQKVDIESSYWMLSFEERRRRLLTLCRTVNMPHLGKYITVFRIILEYCPYCQYEFRSFRRNFDPMVLRTRMLKSCRCGVLDRQLGEVLITLLNLQSLSLYCNLCHPLSTPNVDPHLHMWLANLKTRTLYELDIRCRYPWVIDNYFLLSSPCMRRLKASKLDTCDYRDFNWDEKFASISRATDILPRDIDTLFYINSKTHEWILSNGPIRNLVFVYNEFMESWHINHERDLTRILMKNGAARLELLYARDPEKWLPSQNPSPYLNLTSLGSINTGKYYTGQDLLEMMQPLSFLTRLQFIEFSFNTSLPTWWSDQLIEQLNIVHTSLLRIYLTGYRNYVYNRKLATLYEKDQTSGWSKRSVRSLTQWQIAKGEKFEPKE